MLLKWTFLGKNDHPNVHFVCPSTFIVRIALSACFYPMYAILLKDRFLPRPRMVKLHLHGHGKKIKKFHWCRCWLHPCGHGQKETHKINSRPGKHTYVLKFFLGGCKCKWGVDLGCGRKHFLDQISNPYI